MKTTYITLGLFAILLILFISLHFINIPPPSKTTVEIFTLDIE